MGASVQPLPPIQDALAQIRAKASPSASASLPPIQDALAQLRARRGADLSDFRQHSESTQVAPGHGKATPALDPTQMLIPIASGVSANFADEILGAVNGADRALHGGSYSQGYQEGKAKVDSATTAFAREHPTASKLGNLVGGVLPAITSGGAGLTASLGLKGIPAAAAEGAAYGGLAGVGSGNGTVDRLKRGAGGTALGALGGALAGSVARGVANLADRTGATDVIAEGVGKVNPSAAASMGTRGQVNSALRARQDVLEKLGDVGDTGQSAAEQQIAREAATQRQAKVLYDAARKDTQAIDDPELNALLSDPGVQKQYQNVVRIRNAGPNPLPTVAAPETVPLALQKLGISQERYAELQALGQTRSRIPALSGTDILPEELAGPKAEGVSLPDPQALASLRKELYNVAKGYQNSSSGLKQEEALDLLDKVDRITEKLYSASPARQTANQFYSAAKGEEEGFAQGFDAFRNARNLTGETLTANSPEAQQLALEEPRFRSEPPAAQQARGETFRLGAAGAARQAVLDKPVDRGIQSILSAPEFGASPSAMQARSLMFSNPETASSLEETLARLRGEAAKLPPTSGQGRVPTTTTGALRNFLRKAMHGPDLLETPQGQLRLADLLRDPAALQQELSLFGQSGSGGSGLATLLGRTVPAVTNGRNLPTRANGQ